jgi:molybdopterin/thiamine biosynthesis adenylyltransferase
MNKAVSAAQRMQAINPTLEYATIIDKITTYNASEIISQYDLVIDATDNFTARYIINDACCLHGVPLVSGSAVGLEGQVTVIIPRQTACYRCIYPKESFSESCRSCANAGVLGPVPGLIGCLQAIEATKLLLILGDKKRVEATNGTANPHVADLECLTGRQILYDGGVGTFHTFALPGRDPDCAVCGDHPTILSLLDTEQELQRNRADNEKAASAFKVELTEANTVSPGEFYRRVEQGRAGEGVKSGPRLVLDVRSKTQFGLSSFQHSDLLNGTQTDSSDSKPKVVMHNSVHDCLQYLQANDALLRTASSSDLHVVSVPLETLKGGRHGTEEAQRANREREVAAIQRVRALLHNGSVDGELVVPDVSSDVVPTIRKSTSDVYVLCRRGVDSTVATQILLDSIPENSSKSTNTDDGGERKRVTGGVFNLAGGLAAWKQMVEHTFPMY